MPKEEQTEGTGAEKVEKSTDPEWAIKLGAKFDSMTEAVNKNSEITSKVLEVMTTKQEKPEEETEEEEEEKQGEEEMEEEKPEEKQGETEGEEEEEKPGEEKKEKSLTEKEVEKMVTTKAEEIIKKRFGEINPEKRGKLPGATETKVGVTMEDLFSTPWSQIHKIAEKAPRRR